MEKIIKIGDKEYTIKEVSYIDMVDLNPEKRGDTVKKLFKLSLGLSDEDIQKISMKEGLELQKSINEINGLSDFTIPEKE